MDNTPEKTRRIEGQKSQLSRTETPLQLIDGHDSTAGP